MTEFRRLQSSIVTGVRTIVPNVIKAARLVFDIAADLVVEHEHCRATLARVMRDLSFSALSPALQTDIAAMVDGAADEASLQAPIADIQRQFDRYVSELAKLGFADRTVQEKGRPHGAH